MSFCIFKTNSALEAICESLRDEKIKAVEDTLKYKDEIFHLKNEINLMEVNFFVFIVLHSFIIFCIVIAR